MYLRESRLILWNKVETHRDRSEIMHLSINERTIIYSRIYEFVSSRFLWVCKNIEIHRLTPVKYLAPINDSNGKTKDEIWRSCTIFLINAVQGKIIMLGYMNGCTALNEENTGKVDHLRPRKKSEYLPQEMGIKEKYCLSPPKKRWLQRKYLKWASNG